MSSLVHSQHLKDAVFDHSQHLLTMGAFSLICSLGKWRPLTSQICNPFAAKSWATLPPSLAVLLRLQAGSSQAMDVSPVAVPLARAASSPAALVAPRGGGGVGGGGRPSCPATGGAGRCGRRPALADCAPTPAPTVLGGEQLLVSQVGAPGPAPCTSDTYRSCTGRA